MEPSADHPSALAGQQQPRTNETGRILANTVWRGVAEIGSKLATLALVVVMARKLGDAGFGIFTFGFAVATLVTALGGFGQDIVVTREVARDHANLNRYFLNTLALKSVLAVPALLVASGVALAVGVDTKTRWVVLLLGVAVVLDLLTLTCISVFQAFERLVYMPVVLITERALTALVGIAALVAGAGVVAVSAVYAGAAVVAFVLALIVLYRRIGRPRLTVDTSFWWPFMRVAAPIGITGVFGTVLFRVDAAILASFGSEQDVGEYGAAFRLFETTLFLSWSVGTAIYPVLSRLTPESDPPLASVFDRGLKLVVALTLPLAVAAAIVGGPLVELIYGPQFERTRDALVLLAPAIALYPVAHISGTLLYARDLQLRMAIAHGIAALANVVMNIVLIAKFGLEGAAVAASLTWLLLAAVLLRLATRASGAFEARRVVGGPLLAGAAAAAAMAALRGEVVLALAAGAVTYVTVLVVWEQRLYPDDARALGDFLLRRG